MIHRKLLAPSLICACILSLQFIFLMPELDLVVAVTSVSDPGAERRSHLGAIYDIVESSIIPVIAQNTAL
jgi:hypothetical protein